MATTIDVQFIEYMVKGIVEHPEDVKIDRVEDDRGILLTLIVNPEDLGRVIGKKGNTANAIRNLLRALGAKNDQRFNLKIYDTDKGESNVVKNTTTELDQKIENVESATSVDEEKEASFADKTRAELDDLDDLDI